jgi:hypothetical protein
MTSFGECVSQIMGYLGDDLRKLSTKAGDMKRLVLMMDQKYNEQAEEIKRLNINARSLELKVVSASANERNHNQNKSYAEAVGTRQRGNETPKERHIVRIFPKSNESLKSSEATKKMLMTTVDVKGTNLGVQNIWPTGGNGVSVECRTAAEVEQLTAKLCSHNDLKATVPRKSNPAFTLLWPGLDVDLESIPNDIKSKNQFVPTDEDAVKVVHSRTTKGNNTIVVLEVSPRAYQAIVANNRTLYIGWARFRLREKEPVTQCNFCLKFGHKANKCRNQSDGKSVARCRRCGGAHRHAECSSEPRCANCALSNEKAQLRGWKTVDDKHWASDHKCPAYMRALQISRQLVNYGTE